MHHMFYYNCACKALQSIFTLYTKSFSCSFFPSFYWDFPLFLLGEKSKDEICYRWLRWQKT
jgi:hypothetical protein